MNEFEASVIVPSRGGAERLPRLIGLLAAQQDAPPFEVHVVLDGDVDGSAGVLERLAAEYQGLALRWTVLPENRGRVAALNTGAQATSGRIIIRCDDDLAPGPRYVRDHVAAHADGERGVVGIPRNVLPPTPYQRAYGQRQDRRHAQEAYALPPERRWRHWAGNVSVPRAVHERLGGYDPDYRRYGWEDVDFGYRLHREGIPVQLVPQLETDHHAVAVTTEIRARRALHSAAAREIFTAKHGPEALGGSSSPAGLWGLAVRAVATVTTEPVLVRTAGGLDRVLDRLPRPLARRLVALQVEGADEAGRRFPSRARTTF